MIRTLPRGARRQAALVDRADLAADAADRAIRRVWRGLLDILRTARQAWEARARALSLLRNLGPHLREATGLGLVSAGRSAWANTVGELAGLPMKYLRAAVVQHRHRRAAVLEDEGTPGTPEVIWENLLAQLGIGGERQDLAAFLFPPPNEATILRLLNRGPEPWYAQLERATRLADPDTLAQIIGSGYALGKSQREIAKDLLPAVNGVRVSARRIARTEGVRIGHALQMHAHDQLGDLVIGFEIHAVHGNPNSRWWHLKRSGTIYYRNPQPGQKGYHQMPRPPEEAPDPAERPAGTPQTAYN